MVHGKCVLLPDSFVKASANLWLGVCQQGDGGALQHLSHPCPFFYHVPKQGINLLNSLKTDACIYNP